THTPETAEVQQPWLHGCEELQLVVHTWLALQAVPVGQSVLLLQPQAPETQMWPLPLEVQSRHRLPPLPHTLVALPVLQVVPVQQPALWGGGGQVPVEVWLWVLQAGPVGQSEAALQPQVVPERHRWPLELLVQSTQAWPLAPQLALAVPRLQAPPEQQPPLHS